MLNDGDMLRAWETGEAQGPIARALTLLSCGYPERPMTELAALTIGQRDGLLLKLREQTFGRHIRGFAECPVCGQALVFSTTSSALSVSPPSASWPQELRFDDWVLQLRPLDSHALATAASFGEVELARAYLLECCLLCAELAGEEIAASELPETVCLRISAALAEHDPQAEVLLSLRCASATCGHQWDALFDIATYLWIEVAAQARRLFDEVDALARAYGWSEAAILGMSSARRRQYLQKVGA